MNRMIQYISECIQPVDKSEMYITNEFKLDELKAMKQDGIYIVIEDKTTTHIPIGVDWARVCSNIIICRNNHPRQIAWLNPDWTVSFDLSRTPIYRRIVPLPWETVDHALIITSIIEANFINTYKKNYIEYGVRHGDCIEKIAPYVNIAYGVDIHTYTPTLSNIQMFSGTTDEFSLSHLSNISYHYAFIDADHCAKQAFVDFENIYTYIHTGGYIFLHDTYPCLEESLSPSGCNDCFLTPLKIRVKYPNIEMLTFPLNPGLTIVHKV